MGKLDGQSRRSILEQFGLLLAATFATKAKAQSSSNSRVELSPVEHETIMIRSPRDGRVARIPVLSHSTVSANDEVCLIEPEEENRASERLDLAGKLIDIEGQLLSPAQVAERRKSLEAAYPVANGFKDFATNIYDAENKKYNAGVSTSILVLQSKAFRTKMIGEEERAALMLEEFDFTTDLMKERYALIHAQLLREHVSLEKYRKDLTVTAPRSGIVRVFVGEGMPVIRGQELCQITTQSVLKHRTQRGMVLLSPRDSIVEDILIDHPNGILEAGTPLFRLRGDDEEKSKERVALAKALLDLEATVLDSKHLKRKRRLLELDKIEADEYLVLLRQIAANNRKQLELGTLAPLDIEQTDVYEKKGFAEAERARLALEEFDDSVVELTKRHNALQAELPLELKYISMKTENLTLKMPRRGGIALSVYKNSYIRKGEVLATIYADRTV